MALRLPAQVWPAWLPQALAQAEQKTLLKQPLPPMLFSATFQSLLSPVSLSSSRLADTLPRNWAFRPASQGKTLRPYQQTRHYVSQARALSSSARERRERRAFTTTQHSPPPIQEDHADAPKSVKVWSPPTDISERPVTIIGAGVLGRRLAVLWASHGGDVTLCDVSISALKSATTYIADSLSTYCLAHNTHPGHVHFSTSFPEAVSNAWMVIEAVPEDLELKISMLGRIDRSSPRDTIIATNSSSFKSRELVSEVKYRDRVLNTLYYIPPRNRCVELMSCGFTSPSLIPFLSAQMRLQELHPMVVGSESTGLILPRIWAAMKRETLTILKDKVAKAEEVDELFKDFFGAKKGICEKMDEVGLDTVAMVEKHFLDEKEMRNETDLWRGRGHLRWLEEEYVRKGLLGEKTGEGLVCRPKINENVASEMAGQEVWKEHAVDLSGL